MPRLTVKLDPIDRDLALVLGDGGEAEQIETFRAAADEALADAQATNAAALGYIPRHDTYVDGAKRPGLDGLGVRSTVTFDFALIGEALRWIDEMLVLHSPVRSERYAKSHVWFADEVEFEDPENPPQAGAYVVLNAQPYARKIERGLSPQAPDGVYEGVATLAVGRYGNYARIRFGYRSFPAGAVGDWAQSETARELARRVRAGRADRHTEWLTRQPAIIVTL